MENKTNDRISAEIEHYLNISEILKYFQVDKKINNNLMEELVEMLVEYQMKTEQEMTNFNFEICLN